jgi:hypothetical protein
MLRSVVSAKQKLNPWTSNVWQTLPNAPVCFFSYQVVTIRSPLSSEDLDPSREAQACRRQRGVTGRNWLRVGPFLERWCLASSLRLVGSRNRAGFAFVFRLAPSRNLLDCTVPCL